MALKEGKRMKLFFLTMALLVGLNAPVAIAGEQVDVLGVKYDKQVTVDGKTLTLNGVAYRKAFGFIKVYVVGLYLENPTHDAQEVIASEQVKQMVFHYLTDKATAKKLSEGFVDLIEKCNPAQMVQRHQADIQLYASWLNKDMRPGLTSISTYVPGKGLSLVYQGEPRGTIADPEFAQMYYRYNVGEKSDSKIRKGLLGY
jgi:hypothetical protein